MYVRDLARGIAEKGLAEAFTEKGQKAASRDDDLLSYIIRASVDEKRPGGVDINEILDHVSRQLFLFFFPPK